MDVRSKCASKKSDLVVVPRNAKDTKSKDT